MTLPAAVQSLTVIASDSRSHDEAVLQHVGNGFLIAGELELRRTRLGRGGGVTQVLISQVVIEFGSGAPTGLLPLTRVFYRDRRL